MFNQVTLPLTLSKLLRPATGASIPEMARITLSRAIQTVVVALPFFLVGAAVIWVDGSTFRALTLGTVFAAIAILVAHRISLRRELRQDLVFRESTPPFAVVKSPSEIAANLEAYTSSEARQLAEMLQRLNEGLRVSVRESERDELFRLAENAARLAVCIRRQHSSSDWQSLMAVTEYHIQRMSEKLVDVHKAHSTLAHPCTVGG
jgi:hypothetical protein